MALSKNEIKFVQSLRLKKYRQKYDNFSVEGEKIAEEVLRQRRFQPERIYAVSEWLEKSEALIAQLNPLPALHELSEAELGKISSLSTPNRVLLVLRPPQTPLPLTLKKDEPALYLDDLQDPGNLGAVLRIADWFGIPKVFCSPGSVDVYNSKVVQASMGAFLRVRSEEVALDDLIAANPGSPVMGAVLEGDNVFEAVLPRHGIMIIGNESKGISEAARQRLTHRIAIPRHQDGGAESLNAAVATGILAAWWRGGR